MGRTAGLNRPPVTRKNAHTFTVRENPKDRAEYRRFDVLGGEPGGGMGVLDTWVPAKEKNRKRKVPTNSPPTQSRFQRNLSGSWSMGSWLRPPGPGGPVTVDAWEGMLLRLNGIVLGDGCD